MKKYRKKPLIIEATQWDGHKLDGMYPITFFKAYNQNWHYKNYQLVIDTLEGDMLVGIGDYIIKGIKGEFYPIKEQIFKESYEEFT